jgi:hypothetical protein
MLPLYKKFFALGVAFVLLSVTLFLFFKIDVFVLIRNFFVFESDEGIIVLLLIFGIILLVSAEILKKSIKR